MKNNIVEIKDNWEQTIKKAMEEFKSWPRWKVENINAGVSRNLISLWDKLNETKY